MKRYPIMTAIALGGLVGLLGIVALAASDHDDDHIVEFDQPGATRDTPATSGPPATGAPGEPGTASSGSGGQSCASRSGTRNGATVQLDLCLHPGTVAVGQPVTFVGSAAPCDGKVDFGDGQSAVIAGDGGRVTLTHAYGTPGPYTARFTAPDCGSSGEIALGVTVT